MLELSDGFYVEYVHVSPHKARVAVGDSVKRGDIIGDSGDIGFCPTPHLHLQVTTTREKNAVTVPFQFMSAKKEAYTPKAGIYCCPVEGLVTEV